MRKIVTGIVRSFDEQRGVGIVEIDQGKQLTFHATAFIDGSRSIERGSPIVACQVPAHGGERQLVDITPVTPKASLF